ncbi:TetR family transcriptional regulator [Mycobacterium spongiae]|uniref:TetR family transcriptional regulator n=1 Tax=Mycobacterium spongiae TaxID=886343 RepID=A0A975PZK1_9MYCO|nr:TetR family transcriptional regulator [Mycobacterium spongiae]
MSRKRVLDVAVRLIEQVGVDGLTMRKLAAELGVDSMSLYNHVANKGALLDGIAERLVLSIEIPQRIGDLRTDLTALANAFRAAALRRPNSVSLLLTRELSSFAGGLAPAEAALAILIEGGLDAEQAVHALRTVFAFLGGAVLREVSAWPTFSGHNLGHLAHRRDELESAGMPCVAAAAPQLAVIDHIAEFDFGLSLLISGLEQVRHGGSVHACSNGR